MGVYNKGILGSFSGKVGPVVGASWRGKEVMRSLPRKSGKIPTDKQMEQREKFSVVSQFLAPLQGGISQYFGLPQGDKSRSNLAMAYHLKEAVAFNGTSYEMLYDKVLVTKGDLIFPPDLSRLSDAGGILRFNWTDNSGQGNALPTDELLVVIYDPQAKATAIHYNVATRADGVGSITMPGYDFGHLMNCWVGFISADEKRNTTSVYTGEFTPY
jgi:hypothetical protein